MTAGSTGASKHNADSLELQQMSKSDDSSRDPTDSSSSSPLPEAIALTPRKTAATATATETATPTPTTPDSPRSDSESGVLTSGVDFSNDSVDDIDLGDATDSPAASPRDSGDADADVDPFGGRQIIIRSANGGGSAQPLLINGPGSGSGGGVVASGVTPDLVAEADATHQPIRNSFTRVNKTPYRSIHNHPVLGRIAPIFLSLAFAYDTATNIMVLLLFIDENQEFFIIPAIVFLLLPFAASIPFLSKPATSLVVAFLKRHNIPTDEDDVRVDRMLLFVLLVVAIPCMIVYEVYAVFATLLTLGRWKPRGRALLYSVYRSALLILSTLTMLVLQAYAVISSERYRSSDGVLIRMILSLTGSLIGTILAVVWFTTFQRALEIPSRIRSLVLELEFEVVETIRILQPISFVELRILGFAIKHNHSLKSISMPNLSIQSYGCYKVFEGLMEHPTIKSIDLQGNAIDELCIGIIIDVITKCSTLESLNLKGNYIGNAGAKGLTKALGATTTLTTLDLSENDITDHGAIALADALKENKSLTTLCLEWNEIGNSGARAFARLIRAHPKLENLHLSQNYIGDAGARAMLAACATRDSSPSLFLRHNHLSHSYVSKLSDADRAQIVS